MYRGLLYTVVGVVFALFAAVTALSDVPQLIHFQGVLEDDQGTSLNGTQTVTFSIYDTETGGTALWSETRDVNCVDGLFSVVLGQNNPVDLSFDMQYWLGVRLSGDASELTPRYQLSSVPYAFWSCRADSALRAVQADYAFVSDWASTAAVSDSAGGVRWGNIAGVPSDIADGDDVGADTAHTHDGRYYTEAELSDAGTINDAGNPVDWTKLKNVPVDFADGVDNTGGSGDSHSLDAADGSPTNVVYVDDDGNVGVGTTTPAQKLHVLGDAKVDSTMEVSGFRMPPGAVDGYVLTSDSIGLASWRAGGGGGDADWTISGNDIYSAVSGNVGIGITNPATKLDVQGPLRVGQDAAGHDVNFHGTMPNGGLFWDADKMALRGPREGMGTAWLPDSIGQYSFAFGDFAIATAQHSMALGYSCDARGYRSTAIGSSSGARNTDATVVGYNSLAKGESSTAVGKEVHAYGPGSMALGYNTVANGDQAITLGYGVQADSAYSMAIGSGSGYWTRMVNNVRSSLAVGFNSTIPTFFVGPGSGSGTLGKVGIGTTAPASLLDVAGTAEVDTFKMPTGASDGYVLTGDGSGVGTWQPASLMDYHDEGATTPIGSGVTQYDDAQITLTVPSAGYITVMSKVWVKISHTSGGGDDALTINHSTSAASLGTNYTAARLKIPSAYPTDTQHDMSATVISTHPVTTGTHTFYLVGRMETGQDALDRFWFAQMTGMFHPDPSVTKMTVDAFKDSWTKDK